MLQQQLLALEARVLELEARAKAAESRERRSRRFGQAAGAVVVALVCVVATAAPGLSQGPAAGKPLTVKAPFVVLGDGGKKIFEVGVFGDTYGAKVNGSDGKGAASMFVQ